MKPVSDNMKLVLQAVGAILLPIGGWAGHSLLEANADKATVDAHTVQIQKLWEGQKQTHDALSDVAISLTKIDGKVDVINQKIDDDRAARRGK